MHASPAVTLVVDRLVARHDLSPAAALASLTRAAGRKSTTVEALAARIATGGASDSVRADVVTLRAPVGTREVIGVAKGILMERHELTAEDAFARLVAMARESGMSLSAVAEHLVDLRVGPAAGRPDMDLAV